MAGATEGEETAAYNKARDASNAFANPLPANPSLTDRLGPVANAASSIIGYGSATKWQPKPTWSIGFQLKNSQTPVTPASIKSYGISNNELTWGRPGLGTWSGTVTATLRW